MEELSLDIHCKIEELPFLALIVQGHFERDKSQFIHFSPLYDGEFTARFDTQIKIVTELVVPATITGEIKKITRRIFSN